MALAKSQSRPDVDGVVVTSSNAAAGQEARLASMRWLRGPTQPHENPVDNALTLDLIRGIACSGGVFSS